MGIESMNVIVGQSINGSSYVCDMLGNQIGWYDHEDEILFVREDYEHSEKLNEQIDANNVVIAMYTETEESVKEYFKNRVEKVSDYRSWKRQKRYEAEMADKRIRENMKYLRRGSVKVKNAEDKIKKRHG